MKSLKTRFSELVIFLRKMNGYNNKKWTIKITQS